MNNANSASRAAQLRPATLLFAILSVLCGVLYPLLVCGFVGLLFPAKAGGSLIEQNGKLVGSSLIGQAFSAPQYFWSRPSATAPMPNNAAASSGANQGPTNPALADAVKGRIEALHAAEAAVGLAPSSAAIPVDLVTASASGLDPDISVAAALYQVPRVAAARRLDALHVRALVEQLSEAALLGVLGEPRVNVLALNRALDAERSKLLAQAALAGAH
ncbi:potassium-transporting ATPase subunit KdpC [Duganella qianjiadongensis]|uniref:Potassium-transporting ATPase KdpC subunit n=1 Tax=Duganella qianjiadongensis TaxID=2692176 RepID=A0ABW9VMZ6_9BURK|nr:potassium-transporting ATPase subunit KdpC [Duganella qianjiadongensis]MYM40305.1 potassium-transporting ATPase subunit KdpC [Duganella qianjiadongensis]